MTSLEIMNCVTNVLIYHVWNLFRDMYLDDQQSGPTTIRLLTLFADQDDEPVHYSLEHASLADSPKVVVLSYVWSTTTQPPNAIRCNDHSVFIVLDALPAAVSSLYLALFAWGVANAINPLL